MNNFANVQIENFCTMENFCSVKQTVFFFLIFFFSTFPIQGAVNTDSLEYKLLTSTGKEKVDIILKLSEMYADSIVSKSKSLLQIAEEELEKIPDRMFCAENYRRIAKINIRLLRYSFAIKNYNRAIAIYKKAGDTLGIIDVKLAISKANTQLGDYVTAVNESLQAYRLAKEIKNTSRLTTSLIELAKINHYIGNIYKEQKYLTEAKDLTNRETNKRILFSLNNGFGLLNEYLKKYDTALDYHFKALSIAKELGDTKLTSKSLNNIGLVYVGMEKYDIAFNYYARALVLKEKVNDPRDMVSGYINICTALIRLGKYNEVLTYLNKGMKIAKKMNSAILLYYLYDTYYEYYSVLNDCNEALISFKQSIVYKDSIMSQKKTFEVSKIQIAYENEKKEKELEILKQKEAYHNLMNKTLFGGIGVMFVLFGIILWSILLKRKKNKTINEKEKQLLQVEIEKKEALNREMKKEVEFKTKQLTTHALNMMQKNKILTDMTEKIDAIITGASKNSTKQNLVQLKQQVKSSLKTDSDWDLFRLYFEQVNKNFFERLKEINPKLNTYDLRHSALIKLGLNIKESAIVLNLSPHTVKSARYRLKKKLFLTQEDNMNEFIRGLGDANDAGSP